MTSIRSIPASIPPTVRTDLVARVARFLLPIGLSMIAAAWTISQKSAGYDRASAMVAEDRQVIFDHEKTLAEHDTKFGVVSTNISAIQSDLANIRNDVHEIRIVIMRGNDGGRP